MSDIAREAGKTLKQGWRRGPLRFGWRGTGIDVEPSLRMWGLVFGKWFLGVLYKDNPTASSNPVSKFSIRSIPRADVSARGNGQ